MTTQMLTPERLEELQFLEKLRILGINWPKPQKRERDEEDDDF